MMDYFKLATTITKEHVDRLILEQRLADLAQMVQLQERMIKEQEGLIAMLKEALSYDTREGFTHRVPSSPGITQG